MVCGDIFRVERLFTVWAARATAILSRWVTLQRVIGWPSRFGSNAASASNAGLRFNQTLISWTVLFYKGVERCLRPLPRKWTQADSPMTTSPTLTPMISETRAPVL